MNIVAIDPSLTGTGICDMSVDDPEVYTVDTIRSKEMGIQRFDELDVEIMTIAGLAEYVFVEGFSFASRGRGMLQLAGLGYIIRLHLARAGVPFFEVPPATLKKYVTSKGNSPKNVMLEQCYRKFSKGSEELKNDNEVDAYCLARFGRDFLAWKGGKTDGFKKYEIESFSGIEEAVTL